MRHSCLIVVLFALLCLLTIAADSPSVAPNESSSPAVPAPLVVTDEYTRSLGEIGETAVVQLKARDFAALDAMAKGFRQSGEHFANGYCKLSLFYRALADLETGEPEIEWKARVDLLRAWFETDVESITARVAYARALTNYAWHARGAKQSYRVERDSWPLCDERAAEAGRILDSARALADKCPVWYTAWMTNAMLTQAPAEQYDAIFREGINSFPTYRPIYFMKVWHSLERWYGQPGEWPTVAGNFSNQLGGDEGDMLYAQIIWYIDASRFFNTPLRAGVEWPRVRRGFEALRRRSPDSFFLLSEFCRMSALMPGESALTRQLFQDLNGRVDLAVWGKVGWFLHCQQAVATH